MKLQDLGARLLPRNRWARHVITLTGGTSAAQALAVLVSPLLTRLYAPEQIGTLASFTALASMVSVLASLRYEQAIPLAEHDGEARQLVRLCLALCVLAAAGCALLLWLLPAALLAKAGLADAGDWILLLPLAVLLLGSYQVLYAWALRTHQFKVIAQTTLSQSLTTTLIQLAAYPLGVGALIAGQTFGRLAGVGKIARSLALPITTNEQAAPATRWLLHRYRALPLWSSWSALFNTAGLMLPPLLIAAYFSVGAAGLYALTQRTLNLPMNMVGNAFADVFYARAAEEKRAGRLAHLVGRIHEQLIGIALAPMLMLFVVAPTLFPLLFGANWASAGELTRILVPTLFLAFITSPISRVLTVLERNRVGTVLQLFRLSVRLGSLVAGAWLFDGDFIKTCMLFSASSSMAYLIALLCCLKYSGCSLLTLLLGLRHHLPLALALALTLAIVDARASAWWVLATSLGAGVAFVLLLARRLRHEGIR